MFLRSLFIRTSNFYEVLKERKWWQENVLDVQKEKYMTYFDISGIILRSGYLFLLSIIIRQINKQNQKQYIYNTWGELSTMYLVTTFPSRKMFILSTNKT